MFDQTVGCRCSRQGHHGKMFHKQLYGQGTRIWLPTTKHTISGCQRKI